MEFKDFTDFKNNVDTFALSLEKKAKQYKQLKKAKQNNINKDNNNKRRLSSLFAFDQNNSNDNVNVDKEEEDEDNLIIEQDFQIDDKSVEDNNVEHTNFNNRSNDVETNYDEMGYVPESELDKCDNSQNIQLSEPEDFDHNYCRNVPFISQVNSQELYQISSEDEDNGGNNSPDNHLYADDNLQIDSSPCSSQNLPATTTASTAVNNENEILSTGTQYVVDDRSSPIRDIDDQSITNYHSSEFNHKALLVRHFDRIINRLSNSSKRLKMRKKKTNDELIQRTLRLLNQMKQSNLHFIHNNNIGYNGTNMRLLLEQVFGEFSQTYLICTVLSPLVEEDRSQRPNDNQELSRNKNRLLPCDSKLLLVYFKVPLSCELLNPGVVLQLFPEWTINIVNNNNDTFCLEPVPQQLFQTVERSIISQCDYYIINGFNLMIEPSSPQLIAGTIADS